MLKGRTRVATEPRDGTARVLAGILVVGGVAVVLAAVPSSVFELERHAVPKELALFVTALACLAMLVRGPRRIRPGIVEALFTAFVVWSALSAIFGTNRWLAVNALGVTFSGWAIFLAGRRVARDPLSRRVVLAGLAVSASVAALLGAAQAYGVDWPWLVEDRAPGGTFGNRNFLAHFLAIMTPPVLVAALRVRRPWAVAAGALLIPMTGAIVLTRSRAGWLALGAALSLMTLSALFGRRAHPTMVRYRRALPVGAALAAAVTLAILLPNQLTWRSDAPYAETLSRLVDYAGGSGRGRVIQWRNSARLAAESPLLGVAPGNWFVHYPRVSTPGDPSFASAESIPTNPWPSSDWIAALSERGVPGLLLLLATGLAAALVAGRRVLVDDEVGSAVVAVTPRDARAARSLAALGVLAAAFVSGLFDAVLLLAAPTYFVCAGLGALLPRTAPVLDRTPGPRASLALRTLLIAFALVLSATAAGRLGALLTARDAPDRPALERAARLDPGGHRVRLLLATRGPCSERIPYARAAQERMPFHESPRRALRRCGVAE